VVLYPTSSEGTLLIVSVGAGSVEACVEVEFVTRPAMHAPIDHFQ